MTREEAEKMAAELVAKGMAEADAYEAAALAMLAALKAIHEATQDNDMASIELMAKTAIAAAEAAGIKDEDRHG